MVAFGFAALGVITGCEPAPPPPAAPTTPANLVSRAQFDVIVDGMSLEDVEWALGKRLTLTYESSSELSHATLILRSYSYESEVGECRQYTSFSFENVDDNFDNVPFRLYDKSKYELSCGGVIK
ncbi:unannotated protein [freshwater metagenome]|uniref:Unannotated protein n=1 Tax=freshwater metagenome TaxID=449393 RepID=A0A6J7A568_9ZZZZ